MKTFQCDNCGHEVFFENDRCVRCGFSLGYVVESGAMQAFKPHEFKAGAPLEVEIRGNHFRGCENWRQHQVCNWLIPAHEDNAFCASCRMNILIPDLRVPGNLERWHKLELAKRRCLYTLQELCLPTGTEEKGVPLRFRFLAESPQEPFVPTGHVNGVITVNLAEADEDERERRRIRLHEPFRTLVGHFRHELGHYYWDRLIAGSPELTSFRQLFGDETADYAAALRVYYEQGPDQEKARNTITAYASAHPWEDWAETWAHYLHIIDMMETAHTQRVTLATGADRPTPMVRDQNGKPAEFDALLNQWMPLTRALNSINRGMGLPDLYPFVLTPGVCDKLRFVHDIVQHYRAVNADVEQAA